MAEYYLLRVSEVLEGAVVYGSAALYVKPPMSVLVQPLEEESDDSRFESVDLALEVPHFTSPWLEHPTYVVNEHSRYTRRRWSLYLSLWLYVDAHLAFGLSSR